MGAAPAPVDLGTAGIPSSAAAADPASTEIPDHYIENDFGHNAGEAAIGTGQGIGEFLWGAAKSAMLHVATVGAASGWHPDHSRQIFDKAPQPPYTFPVPSARLLPLLLLLPAACDAPQRPWDQPVPANAPPAVFTHSAARSQDAGEIPPTDSGQPTDSGETSEPAEPTSPVRVGGPWVRCYGHFRPSGDPLKDVTRLGLLCGPINGMRRHTNQAWVGRAAVGEPPVTESFRARRGECFRIFAAAESQVLDLDVAVKSSHDATIAADHGEDAWPIVQPDRPFCMLFDDTLQVEISARRGQGRFAAEVWVLPAHDHPD